MLRTKARFDPTESQREKEHREIVYRAALEGIVLLENNGVLPLAPGSRIALYGAGAARTIKGGTGSGEVNERHSASILEGLELAGFTIGTWRWLADYEREFAAGERTHAARIRRGIGLFNLAALARLMNEPFIYPHGREVTDADIAESAADTCLYVLSRQSGEGADRRLDQHEFFLSPSERRSLERCARAYRKTIVVINVGATFDLSFKDEIPGIDALVYVSQLGSMGGIAFADIVAGRAAPSGRLVDTWVRRYEDVPFSSCYSYHKGDPDKGQLDDEDYQEDIYVGYRYFDSFGVQPAYPFGYGLGYSTFACECRGAELERTRLTLRVRVRNTGAQFAGKEVVQVYASCPQTAAGKEYQRLVAFAKTGTLLPGEAQDLALALDLSACASFDEAGARFALDAGDYIFRVGSDSRRTAPAAVVSLDTAVTLSQHAHICPPRHAFERLKAEGIVYHDDLSAAVRLTARAADFATVVHTYATPETYHDRLVDTLMQRLSVRDMVSLVVGSGMLDVLFSRNYINSPGAVGNTTSRLVRKGIINITLADGPAGLRLQKRSSVSRRGAIRMVDAQIDFFRFLPAVFRRLLFGRADARRLLYQFTTALPVGLALAQTWNLPLLEEIGRLVGREMHEYGIAYWLAPALNIHRNPLCGRNFEYYSEDPLLSGRVAAAVTRGCQGVGGVYVTVKHFCANNQEDNRNRVSSNLSERALREIYLRGFEIAIREGAPRGVMTSYNRVNGVYTANSHDLCTKVLRNEWGFDGVVMTDWVSTGRQLANSGLCLKAGNDLIMPGSLRDRRQILAELKAGRISEADLQRCAANILRSIVYSQLAAEYPL